MTPCEKRGRVGNANGVSQNAGKPSVLVRKRKKIQTVLWKKSITKKGAVQKEKFAVVEVLETTRYSVNGHFDRLNDRSH